MTDRLPLRQRLLLLAFALIVAALVAYAVSGSGPRWAASTGTSAERAQIQRDLGALHDAALRYARREGRLPTALDALVPTELEALPLDPYGRAYVLRSGGPEQIYIWCLGADGELARYPPDVASIVTLAEVRDTR